MTKFQQRDSHSYIKVCDTRNKGTKPWNAAQAPDPSRHHEPGPCLTQANRAQMLPSLAIVRLTYPPRQKPSVLTCAWCPFVVTALAAMTQRGRGAATKRRKLVQGAAGEWTTAKLSTGGCMNRTEMPEKIRNGRQHASERRGWWSCTALLNCLC